MRSTLRKDLPLLLLAVAAVTIAVLLAVLAPAALAGKGKPHEPSQPATTYLPGKHKVFAGISDTGQSSDFREYRDAVGAHPAVMQSFEHWGYIPREAIARWEDTNTRGMLSLSTAPCWACLGEISVGNIAAGKGDEYILKLAKALKKRGEPTYIRLFPEMNGWWNDYSAFDAAGNRRDKKHSTRSFRKAWQRFVLITRGGKRVTINKKLRELRLPKIKARTTRLLPRPKVSFAWVPQSTGSPNVRGNQPKKYFPGWRFVDWVGADTYGKFPNFGGLTSVYRQFNKRPFLIGEWAPWDVDNPGFSRSLFKWMHKHSRARMSVYYQDFGEGPDNPFEVTDYPLSLKVIRNEVARRAVSEYAPENRKPAPKPGAGR